MGDAEDVAEPLQRVLRTVGDIGAADEAFEQPDACREELLLFAGGSLDRDTHPGEAGVRRRSVALSRGSAWCADGYERGAPRGQRTGAERGGRRFQQ